MNQISIVNKAIKKRNLINNILAEQTKLCNSQNIDAILWSNLIKPIYENKSLNELKRCLRSLSYSVSVNNNI